MADEATALLALWNDVEPALDSRYNDWHASEHVPERLTVPGMLWGRRYGRAASEGAPRYLTLYGLRAADVLDSEPYQRLLREPTPVSRTMRPALRHVSRWVCTLHEATGLDHGSELAVWTLADDDKRVRAARDALGEMPGVHGCLLAERLQQASPLPWLQADQDRGIEGRWLLAAAIDAGHRPAGPNAAVSVFARLPVG